MRSVLFLYLLFLLLSGGCTVGLVIGTGFGIGSGGGVGIMVGGDTSVSSSSSGSGEVLGDTDPTSAEGESSDSQ